MGWSLVFEAISQVGLQDISKIICELYGQVMRKVLIDYIKYVAPLLRRGDPYPPSIITNIKTTINHNGRISYRITFYNRLSAYIIALDNIRLMTQAQFYPLCDDYLIKKYE